MPGNEIIHGKFAILREQQYAGSGELFGERADFENGLRLYGNIQLQIRYAISSGFQSRTVLDDSQCDAGDSMLFDLDFDIIVNLIAKRGKRKS